MKTVNLPYLASLFSLLLFSGCAQRYTRHMSEDYKDRKLDGVTFGIVSMPHMDYKPPSNCMSSNNPGDGPRYQKEWQANIIKTLTMSFKKQKFVSIPEQRLEELGISAPSFNSFAAADLEKMGVTEYNDGGGAIKPLDYQPKRGGGQMVGWAAKLKEKDSIDYIIVLVDPKMVGEIVTTYATNGTPTSQTNYTANVRFGVWSAETGELAYASGSISQSSGFCIFMSPQSGAISGSGDDMTRTLKDLITAFLKRLEPDRLEVGQVTMPRTP